jgi:hypothetical protein
MVLTRCHLSICGLQFLMRWFQYTVNDFEESVNPPNGGIVIMERIEKEV